MTAPYFTTNDQDVIQLEGLYIKERNPPAQVKGVSLNAVGIAGECVRGPVNTVVEITSAARFKEVFGGRDKTADGTGGTLLGKVWQALLNKPFGKLYVVRCAAAAAVKASFTVETAAGGAGTAIARIDASSVGTWGNDVQFKVGAASNGDANYWNLTVRYLGNDTVYKNLLTTTGNDNTATVLGDDYGNLITITKLADGRPVNNAAGVDGADSSGFVNLGETVASHTSVAGTDGTIADTDFTGTGDGLELLAVAPNVAVVMVAERMSTAIKDKVELLAATAVDRIFLVGADAETTTVSAAVTDAALQRSDRIVYCYGHYYTRDADTGNEVLCRPESLMASILSQTAVDTHPGDFDNRRMAAGVTRLYNEALQRADYITLKEGGISALEKDEGFGFLSGVTSSLTSGKTEITRRRSVDYIQLALAAELKYSVYKKNTSTRRNANAALISAFLRQLKKDEFIVEQFSVDTESLNSTTTRAQGIEKILLRVKLIGHILHLVLETEIGTSVDITEVAA
jgi:hypothetical protein